MSGVRFSYAPQFSRFTFVGGPGFLFAFTTCRCGIDSGVIGSRAPVVVVWLFLLDQVGDIGESVLTPVLLPGNRDRVAGQQRED